MRSYRAVFSTLLISVILVVVSPLMTPVQIYSRSELQHAQFGFPWKFVTQNLDKYDPEFPATFGVASPQEVPTTVSWLEFSVSVAVVFAFLLTVGSLVKRMIKGSVPA